MKVIKNSKLKTPAFFIFQQVCLLGSNANNGTSDGAFYWNLNNGSGNANSNVSFHSSFKNTFFITLSFDKIHNHTSLSIGSSKNEDSEVNLKD